jgi:hypothetical protein
VSDSFECRICCPLPDESAIRTALEKGLPSLLWEEGDSSWDKIRVSGTGADVTVGIYRYESPGPFRLTIALQKGGDLEEWRDRVLAALKGRVWEPLRARAVALVQVDGRFPAGYRFECDSTLDEIKATLDDSEFWYWETIRRPPQGVCLSGRVPFRRGGQAIVNSKERVWISGETPRFSIEVGHWAEESGRVPSCDQVHEMVQSTLLPGIGARDVRPVGRETDSE